MSPIRQLTEVWENYLLAKDCFKITRRILDERDQCLLSDTGFAVTLLEDAHRMIEKGRDDWDNFVILSLWAVFERVVIDFFHGKTGILVSQPPREFSEKLRSFVDGQIDYWRIGDKLELLKGVVNVALIGQAKQIKNYRDWVVHKSKIPAANVTATQAYTVLHQITSTISGL